VGLVVVADIIMDLPRVILPAITMQMPVVLKQLEAIMPETLEEVPVIMAEPVLLLMQNLSEEEVDVAFNVYYRVYLHLHLLDTQRLVDIIGEEVEVVPVQMVLPVDQVEWVEEEVVGCQVPIMVHYQLVLVAQE